MLAIHGQSCFDPSSALSKELFTTPHIWLSEKIKIKYVFSPFYSFGLNTLYQFQSVLMSKMKFRPKKIFSAFESSTLMTMPFHTLGS